MSDNTVSIRVWGDFACFTMSEMKVERVSYPIIDRVKIAHDAINLPELAEVESRKQDAREKKEKAGKEALNDQG